MTSTIMPSHDDEHFEIQQINRSLDDLAPHQPAEEDSRPIAGPIIWTLVALVLLLAFIGWLLVGTPNAPRRPTGTATFGAATVSAPHAAAQARWPTA